MILKIFLSFAIIYESIEILVTFLVIKQSETKEELADCFNNVDQLKEDDNLIISIIGRIISFVLFLIVIVLFIIYFPALFAIWVMISFLEFFECCAHLASDILGVGRWSVMTVPRVSLMICEGILSIIGLLIVLID